MEEQFTFVLSGDESPEDRIRSVIFQALGAASVCWESLEHTGIFQSDRAVIIGEALIEELGLFNESVRNRIR